MFESIESGGAGCRAGRVGCGRLPGHTARRSSTGTTPATGTRLGLHTAADVHHGTAGAIQASRARVLTAAYSTHPERFACKPPVSPALPATSWINPPQEKEDAAQYQPRDGASYRLTGSVGSRAGCGWPTRAGRAFSAVAPTTCRPRRTQSD